MSAISLYDKCKADAYVAFAYEITGSFPQAKTNYTVNGPVHFGEDPWPFNSLFIVAYDDTTLGYNGQTILYFENRGHILPMEWTITRSEYDYSTNTLQNQDTHTLTLVTIASFTCQTSLPDGYAQFTATFKSPV